MKKSVITMIIPLMLFGCVLLLTDHASASSVPFFRMDRTSYEVGATIELTFYNTEIISGPKHLEVIWDDTGNTIFRTELNGAQMSINAPKAAGSYTARVVLGTEVLVEKFTVIGGNNEDICLLRGEIVRDEKERTMGIMLEWTNAEEELYFVMCTKGDGTNSTYGPIGGGQWIDIDIEPNQTYTYLVSNSQHTSNLVILDLAAFTPVEYIESQSKDAIVLYINSPYMTVNGVSERIDPDNVSVVPVIRDGRTMLPIRALVEKMGGEALWNNETRTVTLTAWAKQVEIPIGSTSIWVNGSQHSFDVAATIENGRTLVPIRHLEHLGCTVEWINATKSVIVRYSEDVS